MSKWSSDPDDIQLELAHAFGEDRDPIDHLRGRTRARGWTDGNQ